MMPSAPTAMAARDSGTTRSRRPPLCDGSTMTGRCDSPCATATAEMSRVFRVAVSKVRMPRSHSTMSRLPRCATYSAAISHSSIGRAHPALEQHRLADRADGLQQREVLHVAGADLQHVGVGRDALDVWRVDDLGHHGQAGLGADAGQDLQAGLAEPLEGVRGGARLERAAAQQRRARPPRPSAPPPASARGDSTAHGPAMRVNVSGPIGTAWPAVPTYTVVMSGWCSRDTSLYGARDAHDARRRPASRAGRASRRGRRHRPGRRSCGVTPRLTNASPPAPCTRATTASICSSVASGAITTTMGRG